MSYPTYEDPPLTVAVLDYLKEAETRLCLESVKRHIKVPHRVHYLHNGPAAHAQRFYELGLVDLLLQTKTNEGLGLGTRALMASVFSPCTLVLQNDQIVGRDLGLAELELLVSRLATIENGVGIASISLAGPVGGVGVYSERAHIAMTAFYRKMEHSIPLPAGGAGPWHHLQWREEAIQQHYYRSRLIHATDWPPLVIDNGSTAVRSNPDGSRWKHEPDTKRLWLEAGPVRERYVYPKLTEEEWAEVISTQSWPDGQIPEQEKASSFTVPQWH